MRPAKTLFLWFILAITKIPATIAQPVMHDATFTDVDGVLHRLYADYLDQNKVVVLKFFFTTCPPCIANAPLWQQKYIQHGAGSQGVQFFNCTSITSDSDAKVAAFENTYGQTMPGVSHDGGASAITGPFKNGQYGSWYGTPSFAVISPNRKLAYPVLFSELDQKIAQAKTETVVIPTLYTLQIQNATPLPDGHVRWWLRDGDAPTNAYEITKNAQGTWQFTYPSTAYPSLKKPEIILESLAPATAIELKASDMLAITKHILQIEAFTDPRKKLAADVNRSGTVTASDLLAIRKVILGLETHFPNNTGTYMQYPGPVAVPVAGGSSQAQISTEVIRMGKVK